MLFEFLTSQLPNHIWPDHEDFERSPMWVFCMRQFNLAKDDDKDGEDDDEDEGDEDTDSSSRSGYKCVCGGHGADEWGISESGNLKGPFTSSFFKNFAIFGMAFMHFLSCRTVIKIKDSFLTLWNECHSSWHCVISAKESKALSEGFF